MSRRIDRDDLANPTVLDHDNIGNDWHVRIGTVAGKPFTFVTPTEAAEIAAAWASVAFDLAAREEWPIDRVDALVGHLRPNAGRLRGMGQVPSLAPDGVDRRPCVCGHPQAEGVLHRTDGPCFHVARSETGTLDEGGAL